MTTLARTLGPVEATSIVVGGIIGSGIFVSPAITARDTGAPGLSILVWVVAGLVATCGALCFAELSAAMPETGGTYVFLKRAYRLPSIAFLFGWAGFFATFPGPIAAVATTFAEYATVILAPLMPYGVVEKRILAITVILALTAVNYVSVRGGGRIQTVATTLNVAALVGVVGAGFLFGHPSLARLGPLVPAGVSTGSLVPAFGTALIAAFFAYNSWTYSSYVGGEVRRPERTLPLSIMAGIGIVSVVYLTVNLTVLAVVPFDRLVASTRPAAEVGRSASGTGRSNLIDPRVPAGRQSGYSIRTPTR